MSQLRYIDADKVRASRPGGALLPRVEIVDELVILAAQLRRVFPLSSPGEYISIQDGSSNEVAILRNVDGLDGPTKAIFEEELDRRYFTPTIERLDELRQEAGMWRFVVQTQRGPTQFYVRNWRDSAFEISPNRWQIHSVDGGRFDIPNLEALDANSRKLMLQLL